MKVLVTGIKGQLGYDVMKRLNELDIAHKGIDIDDCDLTNAGQTMRVICEYHPDCVVHCAAYTAVDKAETNAEVCASVNVGGTQNVALACKAVDASMVYISTDYVFPGIGERPYEVDDAKGPLSVYGQTKLDGELAVQKLLEKFFIVRISWVFGANGQNFVKTMLRMGAEKPSLTVVKDQIGGPTYTRDVAVLLCDMLQTQKYGVYHAPNEGFCSWYEFALAIMHKANLPCRIIPVSTEEYPASVAKRPLNSRMATKKLLDSGFAQLPTWQDALDRCLKELQ